MCGVQRSGAANIGSWSTPSPPDVTGINGSKTVRLGAHTSLHMGASFHNSPFIIYTSASPTENYTFANDVFWTSLEMTNSQVSGSAMVEEPATFLTLSGRKLAVTFLIFTKLLLQSFLAALLAAFFYQHRWFIAHLSLPWSFAWVALSFLVCSFVCPAMIAPDQASIFFRYIQA